MTFTERRQRVTDTAGVLVLLELSAPSFAATLRLVNDNVDCVSNGETYVGFPFRFTLPDDTAGTVPRAQLELDNVGRDMTGDLEALPPNTIITATVKITDRADPDVIQMEIPLPMTNVSVTPTLITAQCGVDYLMRQQAVRLRATPFILPGAFG